MKNSANSLLFVFLIASGSVLSTVSATDLYRWEDAQGNVSYGSAPPAENDVTNVKKVDESLPELIQAPKAVNQRIQRQGSVSTDRDAAQEKTSAYKAVTIIQPENDTSVRENAGNVTISVQVSPALNVRAGHLLAIYLDGKEITVGTSSSVMIPNVDRGTHQVQAKVLDDRGQPIDSSSVTTFTLHRHSILH